MRFSDPISSVVASVLSLPVGEVPEDRPFADLGLDSTKAVQLAAALSAKLGIDVSPIIAWEHPTVRRMRAHLMRGEAPARRTHASAAGPGRMGEDVAIIGMA